MHERLWGPGAERKRKKRGRDRTVRLLEQTEKEIFFFLHCLASLKTHIKNGLIQRNNILIREK